MTLQITMTLGQLQQAFDADDFNFLCFEILFCGGYIFHFKS